jgi:hypothetical protein
MSQERAEGLIALVLDGLEVPGLHWFARKGLKVCDKPTAIVIPVVDVVAR